MCVCDEKQARPSSVQTTISEQDYMKKCIASGLQRGVLYQRGPVLLCSKERVPGVLDGDKAVYLNEPLGQAAITMPDE